MRTSVRDHARLPFENRWTSGDVAWRWFLALERIGVETVRLELALRDVAPDSDLAELGVAPGFIRDWLAYHARKDRRPIAYLIALAGAGVLLALLSAAISIWLTLSR